MITQIYRILYFCFQNLLSFNLMGVREYPEKISLSLVFLPWDNPRQLFLFSVEERMTNLSADRLQRHSDTMEFRPWIE